MKIRPLEAELFHADGQTDITKVIVAFRHSAKAPNKTANPIRCEVMHLLYHGVFFTVKILNDFKVHPRTLFHLGPYEKSGLL